MHDSKELHPTKYLFTPSESKKDQRINDEHQRHFCFRFRFARCEWALTKKRSGAYVPKTAADPGYRRRNDTWKQHSVILLLASFTERKQAK